MKLHGRGIINHRGGKSHVQNGNSLEEWRTIVSWLNPATNFAACFIKLPRRKDRSCFSIFNLNSLRLLLSGLWIRSIPSSCRVSLILQGRCSRKFCWQSQTSFSSVYFWILQPSSRSVFPLSLLFAKSVITMRPVWSTRLKPFHTEVPFPAGIRGELEYQT